MGKPLVIIGTGEHALMAKYYFSDDSDYDVVAFSVEAAYLKEPVLEGLPVIPYEDLARRFPPDRITVFVGIAYNQMNRLRKRFFDDLKSKGYSFATYISSRAVVSKNSTIGDSTFILEACVVQPNAHVGNNVILCTATVVGHRTVISDHVYAVGAYICGYCEIGEGSFLGAKSIYNNSIKVGPYALVASGALVTRDVDGQKVYAGSPARAVPGKSSFDAGLYPTRSTAG